MNLAFYMKLALKEAEKALEHGDVPVGALIVHQGEIIAKAHNQVELLKDPTAHAEILAITQAADFLKSKRLTETSLFTTLEPCAMCAGAIVHARIKNLFYAAHDPKCGGCGSVTDVLSATGVNHIVSPSAGLEREASESLLKMFFQNLRDQKREN